MKLILLLVLIAFSPTLQEREEPDLVVVKFGWATENQSSGVIRGAQRPGGPITAPMGDGRDLGSRKAELRKIDQKAAVSADKPLHNYQLHLELKNTGAKVVRGLVLEYRPTAGPDDYQPKQYLCALQIKPNEKQILDIWTPYVPVKVISAKEIKDPLKDGAVIINHLEYADGSVWKKAGWNYRLPAESLQKLTEGNCSVF